MEAVKADFVEDDAEDDIHQGSPDAGDAAGVKVHPPLGRSMPHHQQCAYDHYRHVERGYHHRP